MVPGSSAVAWRRTVGSERKTYVPAGAWKLSSSSVNVAEPRATKYSSSWPEPSSVWGSTTSSPALRATYALVPNAPIPSSWRTGSQRSGPGQGLDVVEAGDAPAVAHASPILKWQPE